MSKFPLNPKSEILNPRPISLDPNLQILNPRPNSGPRFGECKFDLEKSCFLEEKFNHQGEHGTQARAGLTPLYSRTATITGPSLDQTSGEHGGIARAPQAGAGLCPLYTVGRPPLPDRHLIGRVVAPWT